MVAVAYAWVHNVQVAAPATRVGAYADNWGWATQVAQDHPLIFRATVDFVKAMGMEIDWQKSWYWSTDARHQRFILQAVKTHTHIAVSKVAHAQDLGCTMTYHGPPSFQSITKRSQEGKKRLANLMQMPFPLHVKCHLAKAGIYPVFLMGVEFVPVQPQVFTNFRTALANALLGSSVSRNSAMAVNCIPGLCDPELEAVLKSIRALKHFVMCSSLEDTRRAFHLLAQHSGVAKQCRGPLGTLKHYCHRMGWSILPDGLIAVTGFITLSIRETGMSDFRLWILKAWQTDLATFHSQRKSWKNLPPIDLQSTKSIIASLPPTHQVILPNEISAAYQTATQQMSWDNQIDGLCKYCGQEDTRFHRVFTCSATADVRLDYQELLHQLEDNQSVWHELPVLFQQPNSECIDTIHFRQPPVECTAATLARLNSLPYRLHIYTDGSCHHPTSYNTRFASYAVILDLCPDDDSRIFEANRWKSTKMMPHTLQPLILSRLQGTQMIHRAELFAVVQVCEGLCCILIHTDSNYVLTAVARCREVTNPMHLVLQDNPDLLFRLWHALHQGDHCFVKIKAHRDPSLELDALQRYHLLGNQQVNDMAIRTNLHLHVPIVQELQDFHAAVELERQQLASFYNLQIALNIARAKLADADQQSNVSSQVRPEQSNVTTLSQLQQWTVTEQWERTKPSMDLTQHAVWGKTLSKQLVDWLSQLQWPSNQSSPDEFGVTWLELACSFWQTVGCFIPVKRQDQQGTWRANITTAKLHQVKFSEQAKMLSQWVDQLGELTDVRLIPDCPRGLVRSCYVIGSKIQSSGMKIRCARCHTHTKLTRWKCSAVISKTIERNPWDLYRNLIWFLWWNDLKLPWNERAKVAHQMSGKVRQWKKCPQRKLSFT